MKEYLHLEVQCQDDPGHMSQTRMEKVTGSGRPGSSPVPILPAPVQRANGLIVCWAHRFSLGHLA